MQKFIWNGVRENTQGDRIQKHIFDVFIFLFASVTVDLLKNMYKLKMATESLLLLLVGEK